MATQHVSPLSSGRRWLVRGILVLATVVGIAAIFAVWANRQVLDADNWADTSSALLEHDAIRTQVANYLVDQAYANVDVTGEVRAALPPRLDPLAGPAANALRQLAEKRTDRLLDRPRVQQAWEEANRLTAQQFIKIADGDSRAITVNGDAVILDVRAVLVDLVRRLGASGKLVGKIPPEAGRIKIMSADQVSALQNSVSAVRGLSAVLPFLAVALFALAVFLSPGRRRRVLAYAGGGFVIAGIVVLVGRNVAQAAIIMGLPVMLAAWVAGPMRAAVAVRRAAAPWLRDRPGVSYGVLAAVLLLVVAWGPIPATRMVLPVLLMVGLATAGLATLRRQVAEEFPDLTTADVGASLRGGASRALQVASAPRAGNGTAVVPPPPPATPTAVTPA